MKRKLQVKCTTSFRSPRSTSTAHRACSDDHDARLTRWPNRIWRAIPCSFAVWRRYSRIDHPSAMALGPFQGLKEYPRVYMSESERMPRSEEHTSELQSQSNLVCRLLLE